MKPFFFFLLLLPFLHIPAYAFDSEDDMTVDRADSIDIDEFHEQDDAIIIWNDEGEGLLSGGGGAISTYDNQTQASQTTPTNTNPASKNAVSEEVIGNKPATPRYRNQTVVDKQFASGQAIKVRAEYKLTLDPSLKDIPTLFDAIGGLHLQLNNYCPNGWKKEEEWHLPTDKGNTYFIHYTVKCR